MNAETMMQEMESLFKGRLFLTIEDVTSLLMCDEKTVLNWTKRVDKTRRPPRIYIGSSIGNNLRFPTKPFLNWLVKELAGA